MVLVLVVVVASVLAVVEFPGALDVAFGTVSYGSDHGSNPCALDVAFGAVSSGSDHGSSPDSVVHSVPDSDGVVHLDEAINSAQKYQS